MQIYAALVILHTLQSSNIITHLKLLHWLPVKVRCTYEIACLCYHCHSSTAPLHVAEMLQKKPSHNCNTRCSSCTMPLLNRPAHSRATHGDRSFSFASSSVRNTFPNDVRCALSRLSLKSRLKTYLFLSVNKDWTFSFITMHMCMVWPCHSFVYGLSYRYINVYLIKWKKVKFINHDYLPILLFLYIFLYIMFAYLMLFGVLSNAVYLHKASFCYWLCKCFLFSCFVLVYWNIVFFLFQVWSCMMFSAFNLLVIPNYIITQFFMWKGYVLSGEKTLRNYHLPTLIGKEIGTIFSALQQSPPWFPYSTSIVWYVSKRLRVLCLASGLTASQTTESALSSTTTLSVSASLSASDSLSVFLIDIYAEQRWTHSVHTLCRAASTQDAFLAISP